jgi:hypothetical protein
MPITKADIENFSIADRIFIGVDTDSTGIIETEKYAPSGSNLASSGVSIKGSITVSDPDRELEPDNGRVTGGFLLYGVDNSAWRTFASLLQPGDEIRAKILVAICSPAMKSAGFYQDELELQVVRQDVESQEEKKLVFLMDYHTYSDPRSSYVCRTRPKKAA